jgi:hypothetical protein
MAAHWQITATPPHPRTPSTPHPAHTLTHCRSPGRVIAVDYQPFNATRTLQKFFQEHTRIAVVLLALALAILSYSVLDPIRAFFIKVHSSVIANSLGLTT